MKTEIHPVSVYLKSLHMKKILLGLGVCLASSVGFSQQLFQTTQFMVNPYTLNPALAGSEDFLDIKAGYRKQWTGFEESDGYISDAGGSVSPTTTYLSAHSALGHSHEYYRDPRHERQNFHGVGGFVLSDKLAGISRTSGYLSYSFNMRLLAPRNGGGSMYGFNGRDKKIGVRMVIGAHLGFIQQKIDASVLRDYTSLSNGGVNTDPLLGEYSPDWAPDASLGTWIYSNYFYAGLAVRRVLGNDLDYNVESTTGDDITSNFTLSRHYNVMGGYKFFMSETFLIEPSMIVKLEKSLRYTSADLNVLFTYDNTFTNNRSGGRSGGDVHAFTGITYRTGSALAFLVGGVFLDRYEVAYSFDLSTNRLRKFENGTHEITVGLRIQPPKVLRTAETHRNHFK